MVSEANNEVQIGRYTHFKGGKYEVIGVARHSEGEEDMVVYKCLYGTFDLWVRPKSMFLSTVEREGETVRRFAYVGPRASEAE